jgi:hypothetical protein
MSERLRTWRRSDAGVDLGTEAGRAKPVHLTCDYLENPLAVDDERPVLGWEIVSPSGCYLQSGYRILVASSASLLAAEKADLWDSGELASDRQLQVEYSGLPLRPGMPCHWKVRLRDGRGELSEWSEAAFWRIGLLSRGWSAQWIGLDSRYAKSYDPGIPYYCADDFDKGDSLFHHSLDDPDSHVDTEFAEMLSYSIYKGFTLGFWGREHLEAADAMRAAARAKVDPQGYVQGCSGSPTFDKPGTSVEGQAFFLLMESAAARADLLM